MSGHEQDTDLRDSTPGSTGPEGAAGGMGVSSERVGHTSPGEVRTDGVRNTSEEPPAQVEQTEPGDTSVPEEPDERAELPEQHED